MTMRLNLKVYFFFATFFILLASGRLGSSDAYGQLQAATMFAVNGAFGMVNPPLDSGWVRSPHGKYYEPHDIGNIVLMYLPAKIGMMLTSALPESQIYEPSIAAKFGVAICITLWSALGCLFVVKLFNCFWEFRPSFLLGLAFVVTTIFWPYTKSAWDVGGGCVGVAILLYGAAKILSPKTPPLGAYIAIAFGFLIAVSFRYSLIPFLGFAVVLLGWICRRKLNVSYLAFAIAIVTIGLMPTLIYNYVRMGSLLRPATTASQFQAVQGLSGSIMEGLFGLILSPNRGLLWFSPICLLLFALPFSWSQIPESGRQLILIFGFAAVGYTMMIAKIPNWGAFGWGPRYLVPVMPIIFLPVAFIIQQLWTYCRFFVLLLLLLSATLKGAAVLVNWDLASAEYPPLKTSKAMTAMLPYQQMAVWHGLSLALQGKPLPGGEMRDDLHKTAGHFPDLWEIRIMERQGKIAKFAGGALLMVLSATALWVFILVTKCNLVTRSDDESW